GALVTVRLEFAPGLMTRAIAAFYLSISERQLDELRKADEIIAVGDGKHVMYTKEELDRYRLSLPERESAS
ncbi:MAG: hypothetical protein ACREQ3_27320, partial [Candidatus Binatia bacterium]